MLRDEPVIDQQDWWGDVAGAELPEVEEERGPVRVGHVVDAYNCYPGETVTFFTRLEIHETMTDLTLRITWPAGLALENYQAPADQPALMPALELDSRGNNYLAWTLAGELPAGTRYEFQATGQVEPTQENFNLVSRAVVTAPAEGEAAEEAVAVAVRAKGKYMNHMPAFYERDELMGRFLMLFESFWAPISGQIDTIHYYFDPRITPAGFLPWLASWLDLALDQRWPEARQRRLIRWAIALHRSRGTKWGLLKYLEIYTGQKAEIVERRSKNFILGAEARMGPGIALGRGNRPHTFTLSLRLPPVEADSDEERARLEKIRRDTIVSIIEMQKPAHTLYTLNLEPLAEPAEEEETGQPGTKVKEEDDEIAAQSAIWFKLDE